MHEPCIDGRFSAGNSALDDLAGVERREIVAGRPDARREFLAEGDVALLEGLERGLPLAEEVDADAVEIVEAEVDRQVAAPIVGDALVFDGVCPAATLPTL